MSTSTTYTMDELARESQTPARTIRYYIAEKLLPKADAHGQYSRKHLLRLQLIQHYKTNFIRLDGLRGLEVMSDEMVEELLQQERAQERETQQRANQPSAAFELTSQLMARQPQIAEGATQPGTTIRRKTAVLVTSDARESPDVRESWERIRLAPGIEIHCQLPRSVEAQAYLDQLLAYARQLKKPTA